ncbi:hypothetical protein [Acinetobacter nectaris]|uniref:hypothetical protein n=1 Tax=Acinetobacter nectaris TaxID=1219382 RepID=UPI001F1B5D2F|nr:hypothetical protein [Acinetobacter nectaris]MCF9046556.1 hypothetical protein [Acinetobacter nectaris]
MCLADQYLSHYQFKETYRKVIQASIDDVFFAVHSYDPADDQFFRCMIMLRELPMRVLKLFGQSSSNNEVFGLNNFTLLEASKNEIVYGLVGQFWKLNYGQIAIANADEFHQFKKPSYAKLILVFELKEISDKEIELMTETRVLCLDGQAYKRFRVYWYIIRPISGLIRRRILQGIKNKIVKNK